MTATLQPKRTVAVYTMPRRLRLREALNALGIGVNENVTRENIASAHQMFRQAKGESVEINNLWNFIKKHICHVCDGVKTNPKTATCSLQCAWKSRMGNALRATYCLTLVLMVGCVAAPKPPFVPGPGVSAPGGNTHPTPEQMSNILRQVTPPPIIKTPRENIPPQEPPAPLTIAAMLPNANKLVTHASVVGPLRSNAQLMLHWDIPKEFATGYHIWNTNGVKVMTVARDFDNCTMTNLLPGEIGTYYATAYLRVPVFATGNTFGLAWLDMEDGQSNTNSAAAAVPPKGFYLASQPYSFRISWPVVPTATNRLQTSSSLMIWSDVVAFRGTNGTASLTFTNNQPEQFFRVRVGNTNVPLALDVAQVKLSWTGDGTTRVIQRLADPATGSYVSAHTNSGSGNLIWITDNISSRWRLLKQ